MPAAWQEAYTTGRYALRDPMVFWAIGAAGATRWSEIRLPDPFGVLRKAAEHGLRFGAMISVGTIASRTLVGIARGDREFDDAEIAEARGLAQRLHELSEPPVGLTPPLMEALRAAAPGDPAAAAERLGVTEREFEKRLAAAEAALGAAGTADALDRARDLHLL